MLAKWVDIGRLVAKKKKSRVDRCLKKRVADITLLAAFDKESPIRAKPKMQRSAVM